ISIGPMQQRQQAAPCLQPSRKSVSRSGQTLRQPNGERQRSSEVVFQRVNCNAPATVSATPESEGTMRLKVSQCIAAAAKATPSALIPTPADTQMEKYPVAITDNEAGARFVFKNIGSADGSIMATIIASHMDWKLMADPNQV